MQIYLLYCVKNNLLSLLSYGVIDYVAAVISINSPCNTTAMIIIICPSNIYVNSRSTLSARPMSYVSIAYPVITLAADPHYQRVQ